MVVLSLVGDLIHQQGGAENSKEEEEEETQKNKQLSQVSGCLLNLGPFYSGIGPKIGIKNEVEDDSHPGVMGWKSIIIFWGNLPHLFGRNRSISFLCS